MTKQNCLRSILLVLGIGINAAGLAQSVKEDSSFNYTGIAGIDINATNDYSNSSALQSDGKIVSGGNTWMSAYYYTLSRLNPDGSMDSTFGVNGRVIGSVGNQQQVNAVAIQPDGKIVAGIANGSPNFIIARFLANGTMDSTFDSDGYASIAPSGNFGCEVFDLAVQPDGKIIAVGQGYTNGGAQFAMAVLRLKTNGSLDTSFNATGIVLFNYFGNNAYAHAVTLQPDGKILVGGYHYVNGTNDNFLIIRLNANGTFDPSFNSSGINTANLVDHDKIKHIAVQPNGKIIAVGESQDNALSYFVPVVRFRADGVRDSSFSGDGKLLLTGRKGVASFPLPNGDLIIGADGTSNGLFELIKLKPDGNLDSLFGTNGYYRTTPPLGNSGNVTDGFMQPDGKIVLSGRCQLDAALSYDMVAARYLISVNNFCSAHFTLQADTTPHNWIAINQSVGNAPITYAWNWGDGSPISTGATPSHTYATPGYYNICLAITDSMGCFSEYCDSSVYLNRNSLSETMVTVNVVMPAGLNEVSTAANTVFVYPNPASDHCLISFSKFIHHGKLQVYSMQGKLLLTENITNESEKEISLAGFVSGIYLVKLFDGQAYNCGKLLVIRE